MAPRTLDPVHHTDTPSGQGAGRYNVILLDDDEHTYEYVTEMLMRLFHLTRADSYERACEVDRFGRSVVYTCPLEQAELKRDQICAYGRDWRLAASNCSMAAMLEPARV